MPYRFKPGLQYMMPTHFGPAAGPRQAPDGKRWQLPDDREKEVYAITVEGVAEELSALLPEGFTLTAPQLTVTFTYQTNIGWLAGRGYNMLGLTVPVKYAGTGVHASGPFLLVLWENMVEPILTGREQLGFSKIFCDLPAPQAEGDTIHCRGIWMGHTFLELTVTELGAPVSSPRPTPRAAGASDGDLSGTMHLRYIPKIDDLTSPALAEPVITPVEAANETVSEEKPGTGRLRFFPTTWNDMPTQFHIVEALRKLTLKPGGNVIYRRGKGSGDLLEHRSLRAL